MFTDVTQGAHKSIGGSQVVRCLQLNVKENCVLFWITIKVLKPKESTGQ